MKPLALIIFILVAQTWVVTASAADDTTTATAQIEELIHEIQSLQDATFVRNGSPYDAKTAARFLRGKWGSHRGQIASAADFIEKAASHSSTTGKPYLIRFNDGREIKCADFLKTKLEKLKAAGPNKP